jgi:tetratricopeptide (TPR) repeat protein
MRGDQLFSRSDIAGARAAFEQAVALRGTGSEANSGLGFVLLAQGRPNEALPYLRRAAGNGFAEASIGLGDAYRKLERKEDAIEAYETYLARLPHGSRAAYAKKQLEALGAGATDDAPRQGSPEEAAPSAPGTREEYRPAGELTEPPPDESDDEAAPDEELSL